MDEILSLSAWTFGWIFFFIAITWKLCKENKRLEKENELLRIKCHLI